MNQHGTSTSEVEKCDDIAMNPNPAGESLIVQIAVHNAYVNCPTMRIKRPSIILFQFMKKSH